MWMEKNIPRSNAGHGVECHRAGGRLDTVGDGDVKGREDALIDKDDVDGRGIGARS